MGKYRFRLKPIFKSVWPWVIFLKFSISHSVIFKMGLIIPTSQERFKLKWHNVEIVWHDAWHKAMPETGPLINGG